MKSLFILPYQVARCRPYSEKNTAVFALFLTLFILFVPLTGWTAPFMTVGFDCGNQELVITFVSVADNNQDDSWDDDANPMKITVNGTKVFEGYYAVSSANGYLDHHTVPAGVTVTGSGSSAIVLVRVPVRYLMNGSNTILLSGTWKERISGASDDTTPVNETESFTYVKPSSPTGISSTIDPSGKVTLSWSNPSDNFTGIQIKRGGSVATLITDGSASWEDPTANINQTSYELITVAEFSACGQAYSTPASHKPPAPPSVSKPAGLKASKDLCDGKVVVSWDYSGEVEPTGFVLKAGSNTINLGGDLREYTDDIGIHSTRIYSVAAKGPINTSAYTSEVTGETSGPPSQPGSFSASPSGNNIILSWSASTHHTKYIIRRNSTSGSAEFEVDKSKTNYTDNTVNGCETYTYELYASNECTVAEGIAGIKAASTPALRIEPNLSSYVTGLDASKAYYPDKVLVEWTVQSNNLSLVDNFEVSRTVAGKNTYTLLGTVSGASSFEDKTAVGGFLYEYRVVAKLNCDNNNLSSNTMTTTGFRIPYGIVNGHIQYKSGVAVKGAQVLAEKASGTSVGNSLYFNGTGTVTIPDQTVLKPSGYMVAEAWIRPASVTGSGYIVRKSDGTNGYALRQNNANIEFSVNINGSMRTVTAVNVLSAGSYIHVAGSVDSTGVKILINGKVPTNTRYRLTATGLTELLDMGIEPDVVASLGAIQDQVYNDFNDFQSAISILIGTAQSQRNLPLIVPVARVVEYQAGTTITATGPLMHTSGSLSLGSGYVGNLDEIRIWNLAKNEAGIYDDFNRIVGNDAQGIAGYWRCDENFGTIVYDASKNNGQFNKNNGTFSGSVSFHAAIPNAGQLGWVGVTNREGDYTIPYVPYFGTGENFTVTPRYETHQFKPGSATIFLGEGAAVLNGQDFEDISSFKVTGTVLYENTYCGVEAVILTVDGEPVIKDGNVIMTNDKGEFQISVPVGSHYVSVQKTNHSFKSYKFPPGPANATFDFQEDISGINFIDTTRVRIVGRIVGGTDQGDLKPGLGLSKNNIGTAQFTFESVTGPACSSYPVRTDSLTGEYSIKMPPMKYKVTGFSVPKNPIITNYFKDLEIADFTVISPLQTAEHTFMGTANAMITIDTLTSLATLDIEGYDSLIVIPVIFVNNNTDFEKARFTFNNKIFEYAVQKNFRFTVIRDKVEANGKHVSTTYNYRHDYIYRSVPEIFVTDPDGVSPVGGDRTIQYEDRVSHTQKEFDIAEYPFQYPVFTQGKDYSILISLNEVYYNQDGCPGVNGCPEAIEDMVAVNDGRIEINNQLAKDINPAPLEISGGKAFYTFAAGPPNVLVDANFPWRNYSGILNITAVIDGNGYPWEPNDVNDMPFSYDHPNFPHVDDKYFRGYVLGSKPVQGSDFVTNGPTIVDMILRDPPGSESSSILAKGSTFSTSQTMSIGSGTSFNNETTVSMGTEFEVGLGYTVETSISADLSMGLSKKTSVNAEGGLDKSVTINESWSTSDSPELAGSPSDLFFGSSSNYIVSIADNITIFQTAFADSNGIATGGNPAGPDGNQFVIGQNKALMAAPDGFATHFLYTADHIENYLIPFLKSVRNNLFISKSTQYISKISADHALYAHNNDDPKWLNHGATPTSENYVTTVVADYNGPSYTFIPEKPDDPDEVRKYNEQIRLWEEALARNEMEKYNATLIKNISFNAGPTFEYSTETEITTSYTNTFEMEVETSLGFELGFDIGGVGLKNKMGLEMNISTGRTSATSQTSTNTFGYTLHDPDQGDYFSVDVKDPGTGTGPVFAIKGGRSMCPHEDAQAVKYYVPASQTVDAAVITKLQSLGVNQKLVDLLTWSTKGNTAVSDLNTPLQVNLPAALLSLIGSYKFNMPQIRDRQFSKTTDLREAVYQIINLNMNLTNATPEVSKLKILDHSGDTEGIKERIANENGILKFYLFTGEERTILAQEFERYRSYIYSLSAKPIKNPDLLGASTIRREVPVATISPAIQYDIPDDNTAYFNITFGNNSGSGDVMWYQAIVLEESNPDGAVMLIDGEDIHRVYEIKAGEFINKTLTVEKGKADVYHYDNLQIALYSPCEWQYHTNGKPMAADAIDTVTFSVHFIPSCTDVDVSMPEDLFIINGNDEKLVEGTKQTKVPILLSGYDLNNSIFEKVLFQYKSVADPQWTSTTPYYVSPEEGQHKIPGSFTGLEWDLSGYPDGQYMIRAKTTCGNSTDGAEILDLSEVFTGVVDRKPPKVFGSPQPADGILSPDDNISVEYNEIIFSEKLTKLENFDIRGVLNGTEIRHDVVVGFDSDDAYFVRIPEGINLSGKSFTAEFWLRPERAYYNECILSQGSDPENAFYIGMSNAGYIVLQVGNTSVAFPELPVSNLVNRWNHLALVYDNVRNEAILMKDGVPIAVKALQATYSGFGEIYIGKSMQDHRNPLLGSLHELRIWESPRTASKVASNMLVSLSGKETGLVGYWPLNDADGTLAAEKVHKRNATVTAAWKISPAGYACSFDGSRDGLINTAFSDVAFTEEQDFTIELWFKGQSGSHQCLVSNGHGDYSDVTVYYISPESLAKIARVMPLEDSVEALLQPMVNRIYGDETDFLDAVAVYIGTERTEQYTEQLLRFAKVPPTYWSIDTDESGYLRVNNNNRSLKVSTNYFDNTWHHLALVVERAGNTRIFVDGELKASQPSTEWSGFGAARLFLGARGLFNQTTAAFDFDEYFTGSMDEVRIWSTALKQKQIQRNARERLEGDELGLAAYFPFENYEEVMSVPLISEKPGDLLKDRDLQVTPGVTIQETDVPNVRMKRPSSKVDFDFVAKDDKVSFIINEPVAKIENCILDITTRNVQDMHGNKMSSPATWSAYVDMGQVKWDQQEINLEKHIYDPLSFTAVIQNNSGKQQNFSIENLPGWMTPEPREGTLDPLTSQTVTFTVNEGTNIGQYNVNVHLQTDFDFDEKLAVNLRIYEDLPADWHIDANDFEHSMNIIGKMVINNVVSTDKFDKVAAFVNGQCRGISNLSYVKEYDMYEVFMDIYSNKSDREYFELHFWDASKGREYRQVTAEGLTQAPDMYAGLYAFIDNTVYGSPSQPVKLEAKDVVIQKIPLSAGWNWKSFNLEMDRSKPLTKLLEGLHAHPADMVKGLTSYAEYGLYWVGTLNYLEPEEMYMFRVAVNDTLKVSGSPVNPLTTPIDIRSGWNWIGYTPQVNIEINDAFGMFTPNPGDLVKSQYAFSMYDRLMGWVGTLMYLKPNEGYKYKYIPANSAPESQVLYYPVEGTILKTTPANQADDLPEVPDWRHYQFNMPLVATLAIPANQQDTQDKVLAYSGSTLRGEGSPLRLSDGRMIYFITLFGDGNADSLHFLYKNAKGTYPIHEKTAFDPSVATGSTESPFVLTIHSDEWLAGMDNMNYVIYPNPFTDEIRIDLTGMEGTVESIDVLNLTGQRVAQIRKPEPGKKFVINTTPFLPGIYCVKINLPGKEITEKIIKR